MLPNFLILGAAKAGTSSLYEYLKTHPQVYMSPIKEPNFFALEGETPQYMTPELQQSLAAKLTPDLASYESLFEGVTTETAIGEGSSWYLHSKKAPACIEHHVPAVRMIVILRHPAERAYSAYRMHRRLGTEPAPTFADALKERSRREGSWNWGTEYLQPGFYHRHLTRYFDRFSRDQIRIYRYEEYSSDPGAIVRDVFEFIGVDPDFVPPNLSVRYNTAQPVRPSLFRPSALRSLFGGGNSPETATRSALSDLPSPVRKELIEIYAEDVSRLQSLTGLDLSSWLA